MSRYDAPPNADSQCGLLLRLLESRRGGWIPLPDILALGIAQYNTRIKELRDDWGFAIENKTETVDGVRHSWFRLVEKPAQSACGDWYESKHGPRPSGHVPAPPDGLPLFSVVSR